jgi:hypothetical protein
LYARPDSAPGSSFLTREAIETTILTVVVVMRTQHGLDGALRDDGSRSFSSNAAMMPSLILLPFCSLRAHYDFDEMDGLPHSGTGSAM